MPRKGNRRREVYSLDDPVKMYLKQMGSIPLLTRDEEITLAKNIEATEKALCETVYLTQFSPERNPESYSPLT